MSEFASLTPSGRPEMRTKSDAAFDGPIDGLRQSAVKGAFFTSLAQVVRVAVQFGSVVVLSRLLTPADFGLLAMVLPLYGAALIFQDLGLSHATVQSAEVTHAQRDTLFWLNVALGLGMALPMAICAPAVGWFYGDPRVVALTRGFAAIIVVGALSAQHTALLNRHMQFRFLATLDVLSVLVGFLVAALLARITHSYWALFASYAICACVSTAGAWIGADFVPGLPRRKSGARDMVQLGAGITGYNLFAFVARNMDNILIGRVWGGALLGLYDRANKLLLFPLNSDQRTPGPRHVANACTTTHRRRALPFRLSWSVEPTAARDPTGDRVCDSDSRHLCPDPTRRGVAKDGAHLPGDGPRGPAAIDRRHHGLAFHKSGKGRVLRKVRRARRCDEHCRVLRRFALGTDRRRRRLFDFAGPVSVSGHVVDGDANGTHPIA